MAPDISSGRAVVVGVGNVALDVARILVTDPDVLANTDIADHALEMLHARGVEEVVIIGRRGPLQSTFTTLGCANSVSSRVDVVVDPADLADITDEDAEAAGRLAAANMKVLRDYAAASIRPGSGASCSGSALRRSRSAGGSGWSRSCSGWNELATDDSGRVVARDTGERGELPAQLVVRAVGYRGCGSRACRSTRGAGVIPHSEAGLSMTRAPTVAGWIKRGPSG